MIAVLNVVGSDFTRFIFSRTRKIEGWMDGWMDGCLIDGNYFEVFACENVEEKRKKTAIYFPTFKEMEKKKSISGNVNVLQKTFYFAVVNIKSS